MVRAKRRPFQIVRLLLCADICRHSIHGIVMQCILLHGTFFPAGEDVGIRESIVQCLSVVVCPTACLYYHKHFRLSTTLFNFF